MTKSNVDLITGALNEAQGRTQQLLEKSARLVQELNEIAQGNAEAFAASSKAAAKGLETLGREASEFGRRNFEEVSTVLKSVTSVKSPSEFFELQTDLARSVFNFVTQTSMLGDYFVELGGQIATPLANRYVAAAERIKVATLEI